MVHAHDKKSSNKIARRAFTRILVVVTLSLVSVLAFAAASRLIVVDAKLSPVVRNAAFERRNSRISVRSATTAVPVNPALMATITVDRSDDVAAASACTAAANDCSLRGAVAFANLNPGTTISVPAGTYQLNIAGGAGEGFSGNNSIGDLDVTANNTTITGAGPATTTIQQTAPNDRVLEINPFLDANFTFGISGVTLNGGKETTAVGGGGIVAGSINNSTTVTDCVISGNSASGVGTFGGGGIMVQGGSLTITGTTLSNNSSTASGGGLTYTAGDPILRLPSNGTLSISGSTFSGNSANSAAAGGGAADLFNFSGSIGTYSVNSSSFSNNTAANGSGGAIIVETGPLTVTTSSFSGNSAGNRGGAVFSASSAAISYSRLVGNTVPVATNGLTVFNSGGVASADNNWWGSNAGPSANDFRNNVGSVTPASFLELRVVASPDTICTGGSAVLTADIKKINSGGILTTELNGLPTFTAVFNNVVNGSLSGATNFVNGSATATYTATGTGAGSADVTADNQTLTANISITGTTTSDPADQTVCQGATANFSTTASGGAPFTYAWTLDGSPFGGNTDSISIPTASLSFGPHTVEVTVTGSGSCGSATQTATLTVQAPTTTTDPADVSVCNGVDAHFSTTAGGTGPFSYSWTLDGSPFNGNSPSITIPTGSLSPGNHTVSVTTTGTCGSAIQTAVLTVGGNPTITLSSTSATIWPPNHQYQTFNIADFVASASSDCDESVDINDVVIQKVSSDELEENPDGADGNTLNDIVIAPDCKSVQLRGERDSNLNGRVYTITFKVTDSYGNSTTATVKVYVPLNNSSSAGDSGAAAGYTVNSDCP